MHDWIKYLPTWGEVRAASRRHWKKGAVVAGGLFVAIAAVTFSLPRTYYSEAKLLVKTGGWENTLDASGSTGQAVSYFEPRENEINSILDLISSRAVTEGVVDLLGVDALLYGGPIPALGQASAAPRSQPAEAVRQRAIVQLEKQMKVWIPKRSNTIGLRCEARSPQLAQAINAAYIAAYQRVHAEANSTKGGYEFFAEQQRLLREKWEQATGALRDAKDKLGVSTLSARRAALEGQLGDVQKGLLASETDSATAAGRIESLRKALENTPKFTETARAENANAAADTMRGNLYTLQMKQKELLARYTADHPLAQDINEQVASLEGLLEKEGRTRVQSTSSLNPAWSQLESSLLSETSRLDSLTAGIQRLQEQQTTLLGQLRQLNNNEIQLGQLQQAADVAEKSCFETSQRLEQARIHRELAEQRITKVNVFQTPSFVSKAIAPKRSLILALGAVVSAFCGVGTIAAFACLRRRFQSLEDLSRRLQLPVIVTLQPQWSAA
jgi:uncharacterized protein involved in exopolysaccharide biosynthesis